MMLIMILRAVVSPAKALIPAIRPLLSAALHDILDTVSRVFPHAEHGLNRKREQGPVLLFLLFCFRFIYSVHGQAFCHLMSPLSLSSYRREHTTTLFHDISQAIRVTAVCLWMCVISRCGLCCVWGWSDVQWGWRLGNLFQCTDLSLPTQNTCC